MNKIINLTPQRLTETYSFKNQKTSSLNGTVFARNLGLPSYRLDIDYLFNSVKSYSLDLPSLINSIAKEDTLLVPLHQHIADENGDFRVFSSIDPSIFLIDGSIVENPVKVITGDKYRLQGVSSNSQQLILVPVSKVNDSFSNIQLKSSCVGTGSYQFTTICKIQEQSLTNTVEDLPFKLNYINNTYDTTKIYGTSFEAGDKRTELMFGKTRTQSIEILLTSRDEIAAFIRFLFRNRCTQEFRVKEAISQTFKKCIFIENSITISYTSLNLAKVNTTILFTE